MTGMNNRDVAMTDGQSETVGYQLLHPDHHASQHHTVTPSHSSLATPPHAFDPSHSFARLLHSSAHSLSHLLTHTSLYRTSSATTTSHSFPTPPSHTLSHNLPNSTVSCGLKAECISASHNSSVSSWVAVDDSAADVSRGMTNCPMSDTWTNSPRVQVPAQHDTA